LPAFPPAEGAPPLRRICHRPAQGRRLIERDAGRGETVHHIIDDVGHYTIDHIDLETDLRHEESFHITEQDPNSAKIDIAYSLRISRGDWQVRTETRSVMSSTATEFVLRATLDAYEGDTRILSRNWRSRIPRNGL